MRIHTWATLQKRKARSSAGAMLIAAGRFFLTLFLVRRPIYMLWKCVKALLDKVTGPKSRLEWTNKWAYTTVLPNQSVKAGTKFKGTLVVMNVEDLKRTSVDFESANVSQTTYGANQQWLWVGLNRKNDNVDRSWPTERNIYFVTLWIALPIFSRGNWICAGTSIYQRAESSPAALRSLSPGSRFWDVVCVNRENFHWW